MLGLTVFAPLVGGFAPSSFNTVKMLKPSSSPDLLGALDWMKSNLPKEAVIAAEWSFGSKINVLAQRHTIIDEDHYLPYWIYLMNRHVFAAETEREALEFLKSHGATHLLFDSQSLQDQRLHAITYIGSNAENDRLVKSAHLKMGYSEKSSQIVFLFPGPPGFDLHYREKIYRKGDWNVKKLILTLENSDSKNEVWELKVAKAIVNLKGRTVDLYHLQLEMHLFFLPSVVDLMGITPFGQIKIGASGNHNGITTPNPLFSGKIIPNR